MGSGARVGRYLVIDVLGSGGMGVVYAAYDPELDRKLALKLLHGRRVLEGAEPRVRGKVMHALFGDAPPPAVPGSEGDKGRLLREAQAAAKVNHPNVVTVHDVGEHEGHVFIAMEFVDGSTLKAWTAAEARPWHAVVRVMLQAGEGLAAAHACGLVHRDFKPENIMIDGTGRARVMDFGLVRSDNDSEQTSEMRPTQDALGMALTRAGAVVGTPAYMSPEQYAGGPVGKASDQFSFCVSLWEAICGQRPFAGSSIAELAAAVTEGRRTSPPADVRIPAHVRRVLDRGLQVDPEARYPTMHALLGDLARDPARTRRWLFAGAAVVAVGATAIGVREVEHRRVAARCRQEGEAIAEIWGDDARDRMRTAMVDTKLPFAANLFDRVQPWLDAHAQEWADARTEACLAAAHHPDGAAQQTKNCLDERAAELEAVVAMYSRPNPDRLEGAVTNASQLDPIASCTDPRQLALWEPPPQDPTKAAAAEAVYRRFVRASKLDAAGESDEALALLEGASDEAASLDQRVLAGRILHLVGVAQQQTGEYAAAEETLGEATMMLVRAGRDDYAADSALLLAFVVAEHQSRPAEGLVWGRWAEALLDRAGDGDGLRAAELNTRLGVIASNRGDFDEALRRYERGLELSESLVGTAHPRIGIALNNLGSIHSKLGHDAIAIDLYERALSVSRSALGEDHPDTALPLNNIAKIHWRGGRLGAAKAAMERSLAIQEAALGRDHPQVGVSVGNLGIIQRELGDDAAALHSHERAVDILQRRLPDDHPALGNALLNLGDTQRERGDLEHAQANHERALSVLERALGPDHVDVAAALTAIAIDLRAAGAFDGAMQRLERARGIYEAAVGDDHQDFGLVLLEIGDTAVAHGRPDAAIAPLQRAVEVLDAGPAAANERARARLLLARALVDSRGDADRAVELGGQARELLRQAERADPRLVAAVEAWLDARER
jgi:tetratricopeptide (TPR) repeat protein